MSIKDFATGTKKFVTGYNLIMEIIPTPDGKYTPDTSNPLAVSFMSGVLVAGDSRVPAVLTYEMAEEDARTATLSISVTEDVEDLTDKNLLAGLGFAVLATDESAGTTIVLPNTITSLSGMNCSIEFNFDAQKMETRATFVNVEVTESGKTVLYNQLVQNGVVPFAVYPNDY